MRRAAWVAPLALLLPMAPAPLFAQDGRALFLDARAGRCAHCHQVPADPAVKSQSTIGPPLAGMKARYETLEALDAAIGDLEKIKPGTFMPPYRRHRLLTDAEIAAIARYVWTL
ncbi:MAG: c-type cytochrome [Betaproteobacteria bacterium]|nr:c-type cytochrome [Betaproteobacteria bacterium]